MKCHFCDQEATRLCDKVMPIGGIAKTIDEIKTCDLPICDSHASEVGKIFICSKPKPEIETRDYCPFHSGMNKRAFITPVKNRLN